MGSSLVMRGMMKPVVKRLQLRRDARGQVLSPFCRAPCPLRHGLLLPVSSSPPTCVLIAAYLCPHLRLPVSSSPPLPLVPGPLHHRRGPLPPLLRPPSSAGAVCPVSLCDVSPRAGPRPHEWCPVDGSDVSSVMGPQCPWAGSLTTRHVTAVMCASLVSTTMRCDHVCLGRF